MPKILKSIIIFMIVIVMSVNCFIVPVRSEAVAGGAVVGALAGGGSAVLLAVLGTAIVLAGGSIVSEIACSDPTTQAYNYNSMYKDANGIWVPSATDSCMANQILSKYYEMTPEQQASLDGLASQFVGVKPTEVQGQILLNEAYLNTLKLGSGAVLVATITTNTGQLVRTYFGEYGVMSDNSNTMYGSLYGCFKFIEAKTVNDTTTTKENIYSITITRNAYFSENTTYKFLGQWTNAAGIGVGESALPWGGSDILKVAGADVPVTYTPAGVRANLRDLIDGLQYPAIALNPSTALPYDLSVPNVNIGELDKLKVPTGISTVFPFCLPFDFVRGLSLFSAKPATPRFELPIEFKPIGLFEGFTYDLVVDFDKLELLAFISRWVSTFSFSMVLIILSTKIVKGAH